MLSHPAFEDLDEMLGEELRDASLLVANAVRRSEEQRHRDVRVKLRARSSLRQTHEQLAQSQRDRVVLANALRMHQAKATRQASEITKLRRELMAFQEEVSSSRLRGLAGECNDLVETVRAHETAQEVLRDDLVKARFDLQAASFQSRAHAKEIENLHDKANARERQIEELEGRLAKETEQRRAYKEQVAILQERLASAERNSTSQLITEAYERRIHDLEVRHRKEQHKWFLESRRIIAKSEEDITAKYSAIADAAIQSARTSSANALKKQRNEHRMLLEQIAQSTAETVPRRAHDEVVASLERELSATRAQLASLEESFRTDAQRSRALDRDLFKTKQATDKVRARMEEDLASRSNALELFQERLRDATQQLDREKRRGAQLEAARNAERTKIEAAQRDIAVSQSNLAAARRDLEHARERHRAAKEAWCAKLEAFRLKATRLEGRLQSKQESVEKDAAMHKSERDALKAELAVTLQALETVSAKHEALQSTVQVLVPEVKHARKGQGCAQQETAQLKAVARRSLKQAQSTENELRAKLRHEQSRRARSEDLAAQQAHKLRELQIKSSELRAAVDKHRTAKLRAEQNLRAVQDTFQTRLRSLEARMGVKNAGNSASCKRPPTPPQPVNVSATSIEAAAHALDDAGRSGRDDEEESKS